MNGGGGWTNSTLIQPPAALGAVTNDEPTTLCLLLRKIHGRKSKPHHPQGQLKSPTFGQAF